jgi:hypothetical protein
MFIVAQLLMSIGFLTGIILSKALFYLDLGDDVQFKEKAVMV